MQKKNYLLRDAANILGIKIRTARQWIHDGKLNAVKYPGNNSWFVPESEIKRLKGDE